MKELKHKTLKLFAQATTTDETCTPILRLSYLNIEALKLTTVVYPLFLLSIRIQSGL